MPSRNVLKDDVAGGYYHLYSRGINKQPIFVDPKDYAVFLNLLKRYLSIQPEKDKNNVEYPHLYGKLELLSFCLMPNHIHLLIYQASEGAMQQLMRSVMTSYSKYFNRMQNRRGPLFESRYKASLIQNQPYLEHISRYIHLNPKNWRSYSYSSLPYFDGKYEAEWLRPEKILDLFDSQESYKEFLKDHEDYKRLFDTVKEELAGY